MISNQKKGTHIERKYFNVFNNYQKLINFYYACSYFVTIKILVKIVDLNNNVCCRDLPDPNNILKIGSGQIRLRICFLI